MVYFIHMLYLDNKRSLRVAPLLGPTVKMFSELPLPPCKLQFPTAQISDLGAPKSSIKDGIP